MATSKNETKKAAAEQAAAVSADTVSAEQAAAENMKVVDTEKKAGGSRKKQESVYSVEEFCSSAQELFHVRPECVRAALAEKKITQCSKAEAEQIVEAFMKKEVK